MTFTGHGVGWNAFWDPKWLAVAADKSWPIFAVKEIKEKKTMVKPSNPGSGLRTGGR